MTFIISAATRNLAIQVADTRITSARDGALICDRSIKTTIIHCQDAKLIVSFTGLASIKGLSLDRWIKQKLQPFNVFDHGFVEVLDYLKLELTKAIRLDRNVETYGMELVFIGLGLSPAGVRQPAIALLTNRSEPQSSRNQFKDVNPHGRAFERYILDPTQVRHYIGISGAVGLKGTGQLAINGLRRKLQRQLAEFPDGGDARLILNRVVAMLRLHRKRPELGRVIGEYCVAAAIKSDFSTVAGSYGPVGQSMMLPTVIK
jgi:hypothetical protein